MATSSWIVVYRAVSVMEAQQVRMRLTEGGLDAQVWDSHLSSLHPWLSHALGGVRVVVPRDQSDEAKRIVEAYDRKENEYPVSDEELTRQALGDASTPSPRPRRRADTDPQDVLLLVVVLIVIVLGWVGIHRMNP